LSGFNEKRRLFFYVNPSLRLCAHLSNFPALFFYFLSVPYLRDSTRLGCYVA
jgi:hypothetical protein